MSRRLGMRTVSDIGLGCMHLSIENRPERDQAIAVIHAALDAGITLLDTADAYSRDAGEHGHNEQLIAEALSSYSGDTTDVVIATKGGHRRPGDGSWSLHGGRRYLEDAARESRDRLGVERIALYQFHRPDPAVPYEESMTALASLVDDGVIEQAGISNASIEHIDIARRVLGDRLVSVQNHFSPRFRSSEPELRHAATLGITFMPYRPLGRPHPADPGTERAGIYAEIAERHGVSHQQVCLAWELALDPLVVPIPGSRRPETIRDSAAARDVTLSADEVAQLSTE